MLENFLNSKPLYYDVIDYTRMPRVYESIKESLNVPKIIHIIGTNGKGTTGRFLASALYSLGFNTGHYTSPHILRFNERLWLNGNNVSDKLLNETHSKLLSILTKSDADALSYFEYTTLLAIVLYQDVDYLVLEAGLGGEHDATAVFENILTLVTPIAMDHESFLGDTIEAIAKTKLCAIQKEALLAEQTYKNVYLVAKKLQSAKNICIESYKNYLDEEDERKIVLISEQNSLEKYLQENLALSVAALKKLGLEYEVKDFKESRLFGRLSKIAENIVVDVGHNTLAAQRIYESLKDFKYTLVYNSYKDKNYKEILSILRPIIDTIEIIEIEDFRIEHRGKMQKILKNLDLEYKIFVKTDSEKNYLVFGSFSVVEAFLKAGSE